MTNMAAANIVDSPFDAVSQFKTLEFDGTDDYVDIAGNPASLQITDKLSVFIWVRAGEQGQNDYPMTKSDGAGGDRGWIMGSAFSNSQRFRVYVSDNGAYDASHTIHYESVDLLLTTGWHLCGFTFDSGTLKLYVDGVRITNLTVVYNAGITSINNTSANVAIGREGYWPGQLFNACIFDTGVLSDADVTALFNGGIGMDPSDLSPTGSAVLVSSWIRNTSHTYPTIDDNTGSNDGTMTNMAAGDIVDSDFYDVSGSTLKAVFGDGVNDKIVIANDASLQITTNFSVSFWMNWDGLTCNEERIIGKNGAVPQRSWVITHAGAIGTNGRIAVYISSNGTNYQRSWITTNDVLTQGMNHIVFTFVANTPKLYVNGTLDATFTGGGIIATLYANTASLETGSNRRGVNSQLSIWDTAVLDQTDVTALYNSGVAIDPKTYTPNAGANLVSSWLRNTSLTYPTIPDNV